MRGARAAGTLIGAGLLATAIGMGVSAGASGPRATILATGTLTDRKGDPKAGNVQAYAWPTGTGSTGALRLAASASAGANGRFTLRALDPQELARLSKRKGSVDLMVVGTTAGGHGDTVFSSRVARRDGAIAASAATGPRTPAIRVATGPGRGVSAASHDCKDHGDVGAPKVSKVRDYKRPVVIGELNNAYPDTRATFAYGEKADSEISVGFSRDGRDWSLEGSTHVGNSLSDDLSITRRGPYARKLRTNFIFVKYKYSLCAAPGHGEHYYRVRAEEWSGGISGRRQSGTLGVCIGGNNYARGSKFSRKSARAVVWRRGVSVGGVGLKSRSGFSRWVRVTYRFGHRANRHRLCGSHNRSETSAGRIFSGAGRPRT